MKITRSELNRLIESFLSEDLLTEKVATNIKNQIEEIDKCFNRPNEVPKTKEQLQKEKNPHELVKGDLLLDKKELKSKITEFKAIIDDIRRTPSGEGDKKKMKLLGRAERYEELEVKLEILKLALKHVEEGEQQQKTEKRSKPDGKEKGGDCNTSDVFSENKPNDPWEYKVDENCLWVTRKKGSNKWINIHGNPKIKNSEGILAELDKIFPGARTRQPEKQRGKPSDKKGGIPGGSGLDGLYQAILSAGTPHNVYVGGSTKKVFVMNPLYLADEIKGEAKGGQAIDAVESLYAEPGESLIFFDKEGKMYFYGENFTIKLPYYDPMDKKVKYYTSDAAASKGVGDSFFRTDAGLAASRVFMDIQDAVGIGSLNDFERESNS
jgi:hypothetical protein